MSLQKTSYAILTTCLLFSACHNAERFSNEERAMSPSAMQLEPHARQEDVAAAEDERKIIRTSDIKCRVQNVQQAVKHLEQFTVLNGGFVQESKTQNHVITERSTDYGADSLKTAQVYRTEANMIIRIPVNRLDSLAGKISEIATFTDHRNMMRDDATLRYLANALLNKENNTAASVAGKDKTIDVLRYNKGDREEQVRRHIANLETLDNVKYATLTLELYQPQQVALMVTQNVDAVVAKTFPERISGAFEYSINMMKTFLLFLIAVWPVWVIVITMVMLYRRSVAKRSAGIAIKA